MKKKNLFFSAVSMLLTALSVIAGGGMMAVGAMTILSSIMQLQFMPTQGLAQGAQPIISYNYGAKNRQRIEQALSISRIFVLVTGLFTSFIFYFAFYWRFKLSYKIIFFINIIFQHIFKF